MKKTTKILTRIIIATAMFFGFAGLTFAANPPLEVAWGSSPLFTVTDFAPGQSSEATITITNNDTRTRGAYIEAVSVYNDDNLASQMKFEIFDGNETPALWSYDNFEEFLKAGPVQLANLPQGNAGNYKLKVTFLSSATDTYQGKTLKFDICVGFSGGDETCTKEVVTDDDEVDTSSGSSGSGSSGIHHLMITKEENPDVGLNANKTSGTVVIEWDTNIPSTSQVVYRRSTDNNVTLNTDILPGLGYPFSTEEVMNKTLNHKVVIADLNPGITYYYRVVSRASPPTIGYEREFIVPVNQLANAEKVTKVENDVQNDNGSSSEGEILGANDQKNQNILNSNLASVFFAGFGGWNWLWILILILLAYIIWKFFLKKKN